MEERKKRIVVFMKEDSYKPLLFKELMIVLDVPKSDAEVFRDVLQQLEQEGKILRTHKGRYGTPERLGLITGYVQINERGYGFIISDDENLKDVFIPVDGLNGAMNNDRVIARVIKKTSGEKRAEGEILRIVYRANKTVVGIFEKSRNYGFVIPDDKRITGDIFISRDEINDAENGQKVVAQILKWPDKRRSAEGRIVEIIGNIGDAGTDILSIVKSYKLSSCFPDDVIEQIESIQEKVTEEMMADRHDLRNLTMVTIDGEDAKDLDDAVSIEKGKNGNFKLGVHIADVSYYVDRDTPLDKEAQKRGTSVYLVDRVIPMLPQKLSNGICSLNPKVDRLAFSVIMEISQSGKVLNHEVFESVININERMTYKDVYKILVENDADLSERYNYLLKDFKLMEELCIILSNKRKLRGAIDFEFEEAKIILDEKGRPVEVKKYEITIANKIIEEFMLVCNETVAEHFYWAGTPFIYRIHEGPDSEKMEAFNEFIHNFGYHLKGLSNIHPGALQDLVEKVKGTKGERIINTVMLRSLSKAKYSHLSHMHFGLASSFYCHFTSPIRRYPDLMIHRIMKEYLKGLTDLNREEQLNESLPEIARLCSERERIAQEAEREVEKLKKVEFMKQYEGEVFEGIISSVTSFGMFVELDNTIEGLVRVSDMEDDYYIFYDKQYCLIGERTKKTYCIGDEIIVKLAKANIQSRQIDFVIEEVKISKDKKGMNHHQGMSPKGV